MVFMITLRAHADQRWSIVNNRLEILIISIKLWPLCCELQYTWFPFSIMRFKIERKKYSLHKNIMRFGAGLCPSPGQSATCSWNASWAKLSAGSCKRNTLFYPGACGACLEWTPVEQSVQVKLDKAAEQRVWWLRQIYWPLTAFPFSFPSSLLVLCRWFLEFEFQSKCRRCASGERQTSFFFRSFWTAMPVVS